VYDFVYDMYDFSSELHSNIAPTTTKDHLRDFFTFCGKIDNIDHDDAAHKATIAFEKRSAAKTALMLNGGTLDGNHLTVSSDTVNPDHDDDEGTHEGVRQEDKPRAGIAAEYLAKGYVLSDNILSRAIDIDKKQGISSRFVSYMTSLDTTLGSKVIGENKTISGKVQEIAGQGMQQARSVDEQRGISSKASDYYSKAMSSPIGQKVFSFYTSTSKQIADIHEEARRIADTHKTNNTGAASATPPAPTGAEATSTTAPSVV